MNAPLDGLYRNDGVSLSWDGSGVAITRSGGRVAARADWPQVVGARQIGGRPGHVQVLVRGHVPAGDPRHDPFAIAVTSDHDANRLVTSITWLVHSEQAAPTDQVDRRSTVGAWFRPRARRG